MRCWSFCDKKVSLHQAEKLITHQRAHGGHYHQLTPRACVFTWTQVKGGKGGFENILVVAAFFNMFAQTFVTRNTSGKTDAETLCDVFIPWFGYLWKLSWPREKSENELFKTLQQLSGVGHYHPQGNPAERLNHTLLQMFRTLEEKEKER